MSSKFGVRLVAGFVMAAAMLAATTATVAAATPITVVVIYGDCVITGKAAASTNVVVSWRDRDNILKHKQTVKSKANGSWTTTCDTAESVDRGDKIQVKVGAQTKNLTVFKLTASVDREADTVSGKGPANSSVNVEGDHYHGFALNDTDTTSPPTDGTGAYSASPDVDFIGYDAAYVWTTVGSITVERIAVAPYVGVVVGNSGLWAEGRPGTDATVELRDGSLTLLSTYHGTLDSGGFTGGSFLDADGDPIHTAAGYHVTADVAGDAEFDLPAMSVAANAATDVISGSCGLPSASYQFRVSRLSGTPTTYRNGVTDGTGHFSKDVTTDLDVKPGDKIRVECQVPSGDLVERFATVP